MADANLEGLRLEDVTAALLESWLVSHSLDGLVEKLMALQGIEHETSIEDLETTALLAVIPQDALTHLISHGCASITAEQLAQLLLKPWLLLVLADEIGALSDYWQTVVSATPAADEKWSARMVAIGVAAFASASKPEHMRPEETFQ